MTRTDVMASSRPHAVAAAQARKGSSSVLRGLSILSAVLLLALALAVPGAVAATSTTPTSGYNQEPNKPSTGTSPSKEESKPTTSTPTKATSPEASSAPTKEAAKASTLPFTGLDLRWMVGIGLLMMGAGFSIVVVQRRQRRGVGRR